MNGRHLRRLLGRRVRVHHRRRRPDLGHHLRRRDLVRRHRCGRHVRRRYGLLRCRMREPLGRLARKMALTPELLTVALL
jgi:hypothetical protein